MIIVGFSGKKQAGKDTGATELAQMWQFSSEGLGGYSLRLGCADPLKEFCLRWFNLKHHQVWGSDAQKNEPTQHRWENLPGNVAQGRRGYMSGREILQIWGSDILRKFWEDVHINQLRLSLLDAKDRGFGLALIPDVRFPNELAMIQSLGGHIVRLRRAPLAGDQHASETALDDYPWDAPPNPSLTTVIDNSSFTLPQYIEAIHAYGNALISAPRDAD